MFKRFLLLAAVLIVIYLLVQTYQLIDLSNTIREQRQATELTLTNTDDPEQLRLIATQTLNALEQVHAQRTEGSFRQLFLLIGLLVCLLTMFFLSGSSKPLLKKKPTGNVKRVGRK
ncbi:MAG: hypothetical protein LPK19_14920 [Hymenobacteraceae bacterium]|nr:hypothetical protein [Hymenobacteraceae bacterium]MDX5397526.1 hypothetical protein [Hymenobacteraceae bacterium]MDX5513604.1 hypothetical protein [Hymenobacteraceae bacterium]